MLLQLSLPMRRSDVGRYLGLRDESVSRSLSFLRSDGVLAVSTLAVTILNTRRLQEIVHIDVR